MERGKWGVIVQKLLTRGGCRSRGIGVVAQKGRRGEQEALFSVLSSGGKRLASSALSVVVINLVGSAQERRNQRRVGNKGHRQRCQRVGGCHRRRSGATRGRRG